MKSRRAALDNLLDSHPDLVAGGMREALRIIAREGWLPAGAWRGTLGWRPAATRWDAANRTLTLYEISSGRPFPDGTFAAIRKMAQRLLEEADCRTAIWIAESDGAHPVKVWDVRDELIYIRQAGGAAV